MNDTLDYLRTFATFPFALRGFLRRRRPMLDDARRIVRERMENREQTFLQIVERGVYGWPRSPYLALLRQAGCELGDLRVLVRQHGLEGALQALRESGAYVTFEEFKGRKRLVRGGLDLALTGRDFDNPFGRRHLVAETGGTTGASARVAANLDHTAAQAVYDLLTLATHGMHDAPVVLWRGVLPDGGVRSVIVHTHAGRTVRRWFSHFGWRDSQYWLKYDLATYYLLLWLRLYGMRVPLPEFARLEQASLVARAIAEVLQAHGRCLVHTGISRAVRLGQAAQAEGLDLTGAVVRGSGEPPTPAKVAWLGRAGMRHIPSYAMTEAGGLAGGCARPADESDVHLFTDAYALITHPHPVEGFDLSVPAFNLTTLLPTAPKLMLNLQVDDYGIVEERRCGCELEKHGYTTHLRQIGSYSKLTGEGVTLIGNELLQILEEALPARFGGGPLDYQLIEEEDEHGLTRLYLVIHPSVAIVDERAVVEAVLAGLRRSSPMADAARVIWQNAGTIQVRRAEPQWTARGKLMALYSLRRPG